MTAWDPREIKEHDLVARYLTAAECRFQREYRMLEQHWKSHHKPAPEPQKTAKEPEQPDFSGEMPDIRFINNETGESVDAFGNYYPPPPDYVSEPIFPGVYPTHPPRVRGSTATESRLTRKTGTAFFPFPHHHRLGKQTIGRGGNGLAVPVLHRP